jgi:hypothetical protein
MPDGKRNQPSWEFVQTTGYNRKDKRLYIDEVVTSLRLI